MLVLEPTNLSVKELDYKNEHWKSKYHNCVIHLTDTISIWLYSNFWGEKHGRGVLKMAVAMNA